MYLTSLGDFKMIYGAKLDTPTEVIRANMDTSFKFNKALNFKCD